MAYLSDADLDRRIRRGQREERILTWGGGFIAALCLALALAL